jgi:hypothetical protein
MKVVVELLPRTPVYPGSGMHHSQSRNLKGLGWNVHTYRIRAIDAHHSWRRTCCLRACPPCRTGNPLTHPTARKSEAQYDRSMLCTTVAEQVLVLDRHERAFGELEGSGEASVVSGKIAPLRKHLDARPQD